MFKQIIPKQMVSIKQDILNAVQEVAKQLVDIYKPVFETYFYETLHANIGRYRRFIRNDTYSVYLFNLGNEANRRADPAKYSWLSVDATLKKIIKETPFADNFDKVELERLKAMSSILANFNSQILTLFSLYKFEKGIFSQTVFEDATIEDDFFKSVDNVERLFQNILYMDSISNEILNQTVKAFPPVMVQPEFILKQQQLIQLIQNKLLPKVNEIRVMVKRYDYNTLLGTKSHAGFIENAFTGKVAFISHFHKNNKFLVSSEFIQNSPVTITIPDGNYTLETLASNIENALCSNCKWAGKNDYDAEMLWRCYYDAKNVLQLRLYFPRSNLLKLNPPLNIIPNIHYQYDDPAGIVVSEKNNEFIIDSRINLQQNVTLKIPQGEYKNINQVLTAMEKTINDFISIPNNYMRRDAVSGRLKTFKTKIKITLAMNPAVNANCIKFEFKKKSTSDPVETLNIIIPRPSLSELFCQSNVDYDVTLNSAGINNWEHIMPLPPRNLNHSKSIELITGIQIDGEVYNASDIFGTTPESFPLFPDIVMTRLCISEIYDDNASRECLDRDTMVGLNMDYKDSCIFLHNVLETYFNANGIPMAAPIEQYNDYGVLNFSSTRINELKSVNIKDIEARVNKKILGTESNQNVFKK